MNFNLDRASPTPLHIQIAQQIQLMILQGKLAEKLGVNRSTVVQAYNKLWAEGLIESHVGRGTVVRRVEVGVGLPVAPLSWNALVATRWETVESSVQVLMRLFDQGNVISLAAGLPSPAHYPLEECRRLFQEVLEAPTYMGAISVFRTLWIRLISVPVNEAGMDLDVLERVLARIRPKFIYTLPTFQNPSGTTLSLERRRKLVELAYRHQVPIVEDDPYSLLRYHGETLPSLKALDPHGYVIHLSTFSKILFPGLRIGWLAAPKRLIERLAPLKRAMDLFTNAPVQVVLYEFGRRGLLESHLRLVREEYRRGRDIMAQSLKEQIPKLRWQLPEGGFYIWSRLPRGVDGRTLLREAAKEGVTFLPGEFFFADGQGQEWIRLTFVSQPPGLIEEGVRRLARALRRVMRRKQQMASEKTAVTKPIV